MSLDSNIYKPKTNMVYPPFKKGLYLEEYFSEYYNKNKELFGKNCKYIDILWTNIYCNSLFCNVPYNKDELQNYINLHYPEDVNIQYFTVVQYDDGVLQKLPANTIVFSAGGVGDIPLPLIYEDQSNELSSYQKKGWNEKFILCSFLGRLTHQVRNIIHNKFVGNDKFSFHIDVGTEMFKDVTSKSKFAFAPRGYGRSSFRFWEIYLLGVIPIYVYDDINWLPYQDIIDYKKIAIVLQEKELDQLQSIIDGIDENKYKEMWSEYEKIASLFTLDGMCKYIKDYLSTKANKELPILKFIKEQEDTCTWIKEYDIITDLINTHQYKQGCEIGVAYGLQSKYILEHTKIEKLYSIDPYKHFESYDDIMNLPQMHFDILYEKVKARLSIFGSRSILIRNTSVDGSKEIKDASLDFVYIDANHSYDAVKEDIDTWEPKVISGGLICGDDYVVFPSTAQAVNEYASKKNLFLNVKGNKWWVYKK
jgi:hypothetical protein